MNKLFENVPEGMIREDEYMGEDDLIYCKHCGSPRQKELDLGDRKLKVRCLCICETIRDTIAKGELRKREFQDMVARNRSVGMAEKSLRRCTFENDLGYNPEISKAKKYVEHWDEMCADAAGLLLWGDVGTGKTFIAACIANALIDQGIPVMMTNFSRVLSDLPGLFSGDRNRYIDSFNRYPLLIIDDLGVERRRKSFGNGKLVTALREIFSRRAVYILQGKDSLAVFLHIEERVLQKQQIHRNIVHLCVGHDFLNALEQPFVIGQLVYSGRVLMRFMLRHSSAKSICPDSATSVMGIYSGWMRLHLFSISFR